MPIRVRHEERSESDTDQVSTHNDTAAAPTPSSDEAKSDAIADATALKKSLDTYHHQMKDGTKYSPTSDKTMAAQLRRELEPSSDQEHWQPGFAAKRGRGHQRSRITLSTFVPAQLSLPNQKSSSSSVIEETSRSDDTVLRPTVYTGDWTPKRETAHQRLVVTDEDAPKATQIKGNASPTSPDRDIALHEHGINVIDFAYTSSATNSQSTQALGGKHARFAARCGRGPQGHYKSSSEDSTCSLIDIGDYKTEPASLRLDLEKEAQGSNTIEGKSELLTLTASVYVPPAAEGSVVNSDVEA
ncbi:hypothetical protein C7974DRAFT_408806 [Boeremia exigua]|uniref:uncharacterized protein n=1 Tax=Boeremia exigua TaxID=749465 RepID=UPI001E8EF08F|nr:uncharacterized protein C7974DRAFT_408806 [Boeremia exigua]KAH6642239.1 hypothetical protein C7974DRAFT_408806 [Boeremia exigua]